MGKLVSPSSQDYAFVDRILTYEDLGLIKNGKPRLAYAQGHFTKLGIDLEDPETRGLLTGLYSHWRDLPEYLLFEGENIHTGEKQWRAGLMSKRGNPRYRKELGDRLSFVHQLEDIPFFDFKDRSSRHTTRALFITLTYDTKLASLLGAWYGKRDRGGRHVKGCPCVSCLYNRYITALREAHGKVSVIRVWEGFKSGYPHVHLVALFHDHEFEVFHYEGAWRVQGKQGGSLEAWGGGFVDVEGLASLRGGIRYVTKYLFKVHRALGEQGDLAEDLEAPLQNFVEASTHGAFTMSLMWLFRKRAYSISGDFIEFIRTLCNSKLHASSVSGQVDLMGNPVWVWRLRGFHTGRLPGISGVPWGVGLDLAGFREVKNSVGYAERILHG